MNKSWWWIASYIIIGILLGAGVLALVARPPRGKPVELLPPPTSAPLTVYVSGAVITQGLISLPPGSRVNDAVLAAGGFIDGADTSQLNLAELLQDGDHIFVPLVNSPSAQTGESSRISPSLTLIDINTATLEQLDTLPEIGPKIAQQIIEFRNTNGPFTVIEDIMDVPDIGQVTFDKIRDLITVRVMTP